MYMMSRLVLVCNLLNPPFDMARLLGSAFVCPAPQLITTHRGIKLGIRDWARVKRSSTISNTEK